ncbi:MAG: hypothetical protein RIF40_08495 [Imperialibacter sp.]|uniref:hypothetical protein n=1 Tax=Imperialibacter sp. TaxID=2038411 RepID=UPI0032EEEC8D
MKLRLTSRRTITVDFSYILLSVSVLAVPFNLKLLGPFRLLDISLMLLILIYIKDISITSKTFTIYIGLAILVSISTVLSVSEYGVTRFDTIFFAYKFLMPLLIFKALEKRGFAENEISSTINYQILIFLILVLWVYAYLYFRLTGVIRGSFRPSLPFNEDNYTSDSPFYSTVLAMYFILIFFIYKAIKNRLFRGILFVLAIASLLLTGGRSGLVFLAVYFGLYSLFTFKPYISRKRLPIYFVLLIGLIVAGVVASDQIINNRLIERSLSFDLGEDQSAQGRVAKLIMSFENNYQFGLLFGRGFLSHDALWYDGAISTINAYFGILGVFIVSILLYNIYITQIIPLKKDYQKAYYVLFSLTTAYIVTNLISDYYLLTRSIFPFLINFFLIKYILVNARKPETLG